MAFLIGTKHPAGKTRVVGANRTNWIKEEGTSEPQPRLASGVYWNDAVTPLVTMLVVLNILRW